VEEQIIITQTVQTSLIRVHNGMRMDFAEARFTAMNRKNQAVQKLAIFANL
jgi:hypothetical protein